MKYAKTEPGQQAFKERSPTLNARQRSAFIMFDGSKTLDQVLAATGGLGVTRADVDYLIAMGFIDRPAPQAQSVDLPLERSPQERYAAAYPLATQLTASMGLRGFKLNLAVEGASGFEDLLALLPKIQEALGPRATRELEKALRG